MYQECACWLISLIYELRRMMFMYVSRVRLLVNITDI